MDAIISPAGPKQWTIYEKETKAPLGFVEQTSNGFMVIAGTNNRLSGISFGPYHTRRGAMAAIAGKLGGNCDVGF
jgi:hypothetical protein